MGVGKIDLSGGATRKKVKDQYLGEQPVHLCGKCSLISLYDINSQSDAFKSWDGVENHGYRGTRALVRQNAFRSVLVHRSSLIGHR